MPALQIEKPLVRPVTLVDIAAANMSRSRTGRTLLQMALDCAATAANAEAALNTAMSLAIGQGHKVDRNFAGNEFSSGGLRSIAELRESAGSRLVVGGMLTGTLVPGAVGLHFLVSGAAAERSESAYSVGIAVGGVAALAAVSALSFGATFWAWKPARDLDRAARATNAHADKARRARRAFEDTTRMLEPGQWTRIVGMGGLGSCDLTWHLRDKIAEVGPSLGVERSRGLWVAPDMSGLTSAIVARRNSARSAGLALSLV